jgi:ATP-dependent helicase/nuclease subunit A
MAKHSKIQSLIIEQVRGDKPRDLLVSAGAGSGKTYVLVESVLAALKAEVPLDRILVVTFTEKAATELRNRIYRELEKDPLLSPLRLRVPQAWISTIHSFCQRLLREHYDQAGCDPDFKVLSEEDSRILLEDALTRVFHESYALRSDTFEQLVEMCQFDQRGERLRDVILSLLAYARTSERPRTFLDDHLAMLRAPASTWADFPWAGDYGSRVERAWRSAVGILSSVADRAGPGKLADVARALEDCDATLPGNPAGQDAFIRHLIARGIAKEAASGTKGPVGLNITLPQLRNMSHLTKMKQLAADSFRSEWIAELPCDVEKMAADDRRAARLGIELVQITKRVWEFYDAAKSRLGRLDFEDLQILAHELISRQSDAAAAIRFRRVFVDEFQDVNGLQHQILSRVSDPTAIFRVGDIKQSIYQFRLADPSIIRSLAAGRPVVKDGAPAPDDRSAWNVLLPVNYRSLPPVLTVTNEIARGLFFPGEIGTEYEEQKLLPNPEAKDAEGANVELLILREDAPGGEDNSGDATEEVTEGDASDVKTDLHDCEWSAIAGRIRELIDAPTRIRDPETKEMRPAGYSDIAVLMRTHANGPALARRLEEDGIPTSLGSGESFFAAHEVRDLLSLLRITDNLLDDIALAAALRSPAFGWADAELLALRLSMPHAVHLAYAMATLAESCDADPAAPGHPGNSRITDAILPADPDERSIFCGERATDLPDEPPFSTLPRRCRDALVMIAGWRDAAGQSELPRLVARMLEETGLARSVASLPGGLRRQANLRKLIGISRRFVQDVGHNLHRFLRWIESLEERGAKISEAPVSSESVPAVRVMSIHASKGLEFPIVILAETGRRYQLGARMNALVPGRDYLGVQLLDNDSYILRRPHPLRLLISQREDEGIAEEKRILYVALTRARDRLIVSGIYTSKSAPPEWMHSLYRDAMSRRDATGEAVRHSLLKRKPFPLAWMIFALPELPSPMPVSADRNSADSGSSGMTGENRADRGEQIVPGLPLTVRWIRPVPREETPITENPIRKIEEKLRALEPVDLPGGLLTDASPADSLLPGDFDRDAEATVERMLALPPLPSPGLLTQARGKIWATEFKTGRDPIHADGPLPDAMRNALRIDEEMDEAASPLIPPAGAGDSARAGRAAPAAHAAGAADPDAAATEGIAIHAILERIDFAGMDGTNLNDRILAAAGRVSVAPPDAAGPGAGARAGGDAGANASGGASASAGVNASGGASAIEVVRHGLTRLLASPEGRMLVTAREIHREMSFSLRIPLLEIAAYIPDLQSELLASDAWKEWIESADGGGLIGGALRLRAGKPDAAGDPWVLVQGRIDAVFRGEDGWTVVDWKSDRVPAEGPRLEERVTLYRGQIEIYRRAAQALFGNPVRSALYFLRPGVLRVIE